MIILALAFSYIYIALLMRYNSILMTMIIMKMRMRWCLMIIMIILKRLNEATMKKERYFLILFPCNNIPPSLTIFSFDSVHLFIIFIISFSCSSFSLFLMKTHDRYRETLVTMWLIPIDYHYSIPLILMQRSYYFLISLNFSFFLSFTHYPLSPPSSFILPPSF